jgi:hypothetical protein
MPAQLLRDQGLLKDDEPDSEDKADPGPSSADPVLGPHDV